VKLGIIGVGAVGAATAMAIALRARVRELVLIDKDRARARAVATDMHYGVPLSPLVTIKDGDYDDLDGAGLVIVAAGVNEKAGGATDRSDPAGRLRLLDANVRVFETIAPQLVKVAPDAVILIVTDPPEPLIDSRAANGCGEMAVSPPSRARSPTVCRIRGNTGAQCLPWAAPSSLIPISGRSPPMFGRWPPEECPLTKGEIGLSPDDIAHLLDEEWIGRELESLCAMWL
jgi:hypothetical protein